jgi:hypothetical protein
MTACENLLCPKRIKNDKDFKLWAARGGHPDKGGNADIFMKVSNCRQSKAFCVKIPDNTFNKVKNAVNKASADLNKTNLLSKQQEVKLSEARELMKQANNAKSATLQKELSKQAIKKVKNASNQANQKTGPVSNVLGFFGVGANAIVERTNSNMSKALALIAPKTNIGKMVSSRGPISKQAYMRVYVGKQKDIYKTGLPKTRKLRKIYDGLSAVLDEYSNIVAYKKGKAFHVAKGGRNNKQASSAQKWEVPMLSRSPKKTI